MSKSAKIAILLGLVGLASACARGNVDDAGVEEFVVIDPTPISNEPVFTGKYK